MGFMAPDPPPQPQYQPPPTPQDPEVERKKREQRMLANRRSGYFSMFTSSRSGVPGQAPGTKKVLFGE